MTWSIVARDKQTGSYGCAVATKFFAVGALCLKAEGKIGALATQALINPTFGPRGLRLLREGRSAADIVKALIDSDQGRDQRQLHVIDSKGSNAAYTGAACVDWCGHLLRHGFSVAGNMLAGPKVIEDTAQTFEAHADLPLAQRLIAALKAGETAGGDKRGKQSAALIVYSTEEYPELDLRVDDHADPLAELERLEAVSRERFTHFRAFLPTRANPSGVFDRATIEAGIAAGLAERK
ncbi:MAG: DUF1028 domain-containing protein [Rhodospirillales bacterium]